MGCSGRRLSAAGLALGLLVMSSAGLAVGGRAARADDVTASQDSLRTGWDQNEPGLAPGNVSASDFGQLFSTKVDGQVYGQPVVAAGVLLAVTENDQVYGLDPQTGAIVWHRDVGPWWPASTDGCGDLVPNVGSTATPVYDRATGTAYFTAKVNDGPDALHPHWYMHAVDIRTGAEKAGFPTAISGSPTNDPGDTFDAATAMQRPGLLLLGGVVYAGFASHCDKGPYVGYVAAVNAATGTQTTLWATEGDSSNGMAGIWQAGGGLVSDGPGQIIFASGNGVAPAPGPGTTPSIHLGESVVRLQVGLDGALTAKDFFSPVNNTRLNREDADLGSGGPMALPTGYGTRAVPHLLVQLSKDGRVFLLDRDHLGGDAQGAGGTDKALEVDGPFRGVWGHAAFFGGDTGYVYDIENSGFLRAFKVGTFVTGTPSLTSVATSAGTWGFTSGSPVVTSTGSADSSAVVWAVYSDGSAGTNGQLRAYGAEPVGQVLPLIRAFAIGNASKFSIPATSAGRVYVGTRDGFVDGFGAPVREALTGPSTALGQVAVGHSSTATVTLTAVTPVTVDAVSTAVPFSVAPVLLPASLAAGGTLQVRVTFTPTAPGEASGGLEVDTSAGRFDLSLDGSGTRPGLSASSSTLAFGKVPTKSQVTLSVSIANSSTVAETIIAVSGPRAPFSAGALPAIGSTLAPGASVTIPVTLSPTSDGRLVSSLSVTSNTGGTTVRLTGIGVTGAGHLTLTPTTLDFGAVRLGQAVTKTFAISDTGNLSVTLTKAAPPSGAFTTSTPVSEGQQLNPGDVILQRVTFKPTALGAVTGTYLITGNAGQGHQQVAFTGTGLPATSAASIVAGAGCLGAAAVRPGAERSIRVANADGVAVTARTTALCQGYWLVSSRGNVYDFGDAAFFGSERGRVLGAPVVGMVATPDGGGYWLVTSRGNVYDFGDAVFHGSERGRVLGAPVVGMVATPDGGGYWLVTSRGNVYDFGDAVFDGSERGRVLGAPVVGMVATPDGGGYWLVTSRGNVYDFGDAVFHGSERGRVLGAPVVGMVATPDGGGYWLVTSRGNVYDFGDAVFHGSERGRVLGAPVVGMVATPDGAGYWMVTAHGDVYDFG